MEKKPVWLKVKRADNTDTFAVKKILEELKLNTVCEEANCPNYGDCFSRKTATFMLLGTNCTRNCRFCNVTHNCADAVDKDEPRNVALAVQRMGLKYVVVTSVTRDDLSDGGASQFAETVREIRKLMPSTAVETLIPDFLGDLNALKIVTDAQPDVISHNMETVESLYSAVRPKAEYARSLKILENIKVFNKDIRSKTGIMVGLGETDTEVIKLFKDLRSVGCDFLTIGQYLAPSKEHYPVKEYVTPEKFEYYAEEAKKCGFSFVASAPLVRSSYHAGEALGID